MNKYNILLIVTDQHRFDCLGCYGNPAIETVNLDFLAQEGTIFYNAYTPSPSCVPARACMLTGMNPWNTGILGMGRDQGGMGVGFRHTLPGKLADNGYHTQGVGKMHFTPQRALNGFHNTVLDESGREEQPGFISDYKQWFEKNKNGDYGIIDHGLEWNSWMARPYHAPEYLHPTNWTVNESIKFLKKKDPSKPFFLMTSFARPHSPYDAIGYYFDLYLKKDIPGPAVGEWASVHDVKEEAACHDAWRGVRKAEEIKRARAGYYGSINHIDHQIGRLLNYLTISDELYDTLIIFTSDHGDMLGDHNLWRKTYAYEGSSHIPLIIRLPKGMESGLKEIYNPVLLQDIMPTILDIAGSEIPEGLDGESILGLINGKKKKWREYIHGEHCTCYSEIQENQYLTDGKHKYIWFPRTGAEQLFDLINDPNECTDLAKDQKNIDELLKWRERLIGILSKRDLGLTDGNRLVCQKNKPSMISPKFMERKRKVGFDWDKI